MKIVTAEDGKNSVKISKKEWLSLGKTAGWYSEKMISEPDDSNKYKANYDLFQEDSTGYSVSVNEPGSKYPSWISGSFFKGGLQKFKSAIINTLERNLPYENNGTVEIDVSIGDDESDNFKWKTHPTYLKNYSSNDLINVVSGAMKAANELDGEYSSFNNWQDDLMDAKEDRKNGYDRWHEEISPEDKAKSRQERKRVKRNKYDTKQKEKAEEAALQNEHRTKRHDNLSHPFDGLSFPPVAPVAGANNKKTLARSKIKIVTAADGKETVKISKVEWEAIGKEAGWRDIFKGPSDEIPAMGIDPSSQMASGMQQDNQMIMEYANEIGSGRMTKDQVYADLSSRLPEPNVTSIMSKLEKYMAV